jgi:hypothetical protein
MVLFFKENKTSIFLRVMWGPIPSKVFLIKKFKNEVLVIAQNVFNSLFLKTK